MNILINAFTISPNWGSEPGMGWNWIINLAKHCKLYIITGAAEKKEIEEAIETLPQKDNLIFYYNPISAEVRKMWINQGDWRFYWYYRKWQKKTLKIAEDIIAKNKIDAIHQLNMIGFREPGYLWKIKDIPYVWGPVGGIDNFPISFLKNVPLKYKLFFRVKNLISNLQFKYSPRVRKALKRGKVVAATKSVKDAITKRYKKDVILINETGCYPINSKIHKESNSKTLKILWVGKFDFRKQFELAVESIKRMKNKSNCEFRVISPFYSEKQKIYINNLIKNSEIAEITKLMGRVPHDKVLDLMKDSDIMLFTSLSEGTPHVVLEAIQNNLPVLCFNTCGHGDVIDDNIGYKIKVTNPEISAKEFAEKLDSIFQNRELLYQKSLNCNEAQNNLSWENKAVQMSKLYIAV